MRLLVAKTDISKTTRFSALPVERACLGALVAGILCLFQVSPAVASPLEQGIKEYNSGNYSQAIGLFGQAEATEFNNPVLHYYLANALAKANQSTDAIKEYKIAMAIEPSGKIADYCRRALASLGVASDDAGAKRKVPERGGPAAFSYEFDVRGFPTTIDGKIGGFGSFKLKRSDAGVWILKEIKNSHDLIIAGVPVEVRPDGRIVGNFSVNAQGDMTYVNPQHLTRLIHRDGSVEDPTAFNGGQPGGVFGGGARTPEVVAVLCGCPLCHRITLIMTDLQRRYGDRIKFTRLSDSSDARMSAAYRQVGGQCPSMLFFDEKGQMVATVGGATISEQDIYRDTESLLSKISQNAQPPRTLGEQRRAEYAATIAQEAEVRIAEDEKRLNNEVQHLRDEMRQQMWDRAHNNLTYPNFQRDTENRIQSLQNDFEKRKQEIRNAAKARIDALSVGDLPNIPSNPNVLPTGGNPSNSVYQQNPRGR